MEFLEEILGKELFAQFVTAINAHNGAEENKEKQVKLANIASGEYVGKGKYDSLDAALKGKDAELASANELIAEMKKATKGNEDLQGKITGYESQVADLQNQLAESERRYAFEVLLMDAGVKDKDEREFLMFKYEKKLKEEGKTLELDDNKKIKGGDEIVASLKTTNPTKFESGTDKRKVLDGRLPGSDGGSVSVTKEQFMGMSYEQRYQLKQKDENLYKQLANN